MKAKIAPFIFLVDWDRFPELLGGGHVNCTRGEMAACIELVKEVQLRFLIHAEICKGKWVGPKIIFGIGLWFRYSDPEVQESFLEMFQTVSKRAANCELMCLTALD